MIRLVDAECGCELALEAPADELAALLESNGGATPLVCSEHGRTTRRVTGQVKPWRGVKRSQRPPGYAH